MLAKKLQQVVGNAGEDVSWDLDYAYYTGPDAWDISTADFIGTEYVGGQETFPRALYIKPDGTGFYVTGSAGDDVNQYSVSVPWRLLISSYVRKFSISAQETSPGGIFFKPDGTVMYVSGSSGDDINQYSLSTAWDVSTASYVQNFSLSTQDTSPQGLFFKPDGLVLYVVGSSGDDINQYSLSTAWDISTLSFVQNFSVATQETAPYDVFFKPDGLVMYVIGISGDDVNQYSLSTAWDISTASYVQNFSVSSQETAPRAIFFDPYGAGMYVLGTSSDDINVYTIGGLSLSAQSLSANDVSFKSDGTVMYVLSNTGSSDDVNQYSLSTAWDISTASYVQNFSVASQETIPQGMFFKPDGTKFYICGTSGDDVNEYSLSTAWDISTASYVRNKSTSGYDTIPYDVAFKSDGSVMYVLGGFFDSVYQLDLSTAWDISTATLDSSKSIGSQTTDPRSVAFKPDGTVMYILSSSEEIFRYSLSTAWDVTTATHDQTFSYGASDSGPYGFFFKPDGSGFYIAGISNDRIYSYAIGEQ